jgi:hypothetical protein
VLYLRILHCANRNVAHNRILATQLGEAMTTPTTRKFPRTMQEAFPHDSRHAYAIERIKAPMSVFEALLAWASISGMCVLIAWAIAG